MTEPPREESPARGPMDAFYDQLEAILARCNPGPYGRIETYGGKLPEPVTLPRSTVRGWVNKRQALPNSVQFNTMIDFFKASRAIEDDEAQRLRELWDAACRYKGEQRSARKASQADEEAGGTEEPKRPTETGEPLSADEPKGAIARMTFQVQANASAQVDAGSRTRRRITWIAVGVGLGAVLLTLPQAFHMPYFSQAAAKRSPVPSSPALSTVGPTTSASPTGKPSTEPTTPVPTSPLEHESAAGPRTPVPAQVSRSPAPAAPVHVWWCTKVVVKQARIYTRARTTSWVIGYKTQGDRITVDTAPKSPPGWRAIWTPRREYWMRSHDLSPTLSPSPTHRCPA